MAWARENSYGYEEGYRRAANVLYERIASTQTGMDSLVFPLAYLWRHALELQLKRIITNGAILREVDLTAPMIHKLSQLWRLAKIELINLDSAAPDGTETVEHILGELEELDPEATGFRYPENKRGVASLECPPELLDLDNFHEVMTAVHCFLECGNMEIAHRLESKAEDASGRF